jgi:hypothetical protein
VATHCDSSFSEEKLLGGSEEGDEVSLGSMESDEGGGGDTSELSWAILSKIGLEHGSDAVDH